MATKLVLKPEDETVALPVIEPGAKSFQWQMGDEMVEITRLKTGAALETARVLIRYIDKLSAAINTAQATDATPVAAGLEAIKGMAGILDPEELMSIGAQVLGIPKATIEDAPVEDLLGALAGALDLNSFMRIIATVRLLGRKVGVGR